MFSGTVEVNTSKRNRSCDCCERTEEELGYQVTDYRKEAEIDTENIGTPTVFDEDKKPKLRVCLPCETVLNRLLEGNGTVKMTINWFNDDWPDKKERPEYSLSGVNGEPLTNLPQFKPYQSGEK